MRHQSPSHLLLPALTLLSATFLALAQSPEQAQDVLRRDWLFQAMGQPLADRAAREIAWAEQLADRLSRATPAPDLSAERAELTSLKKQLLNTPAPSPNRPAAPSWIWYPEGDPTKDAPTASRFFRRQFELSSEPRDAQLRFAADDAAEVYLNGVRVGACDTWQRAASFSVAKLLKPGQNILAIRAENQPAPTKNPAGLIAHLQITPASGPALSILSDASWRVSKDPAPKWQDPAFDDSAWKTALIAAPYGAGPWGAIPGLNLPDPASDLYFAVRDVKRRILLKNPAIDFTQLLFIDQPLPQGPESIHEAIHRMGIMAVPGGRLLVLDGLSPSGKVRQLAPDRPGAFWRPDLSFDARKVLFCFKPQDHKSFHLYEMNFDGTGLKQLTDSEYDDVDPIYLPDGHILFTTTRGNSYVRCGPFIYSYTLARCDADGSNVYLISCNGEPDFVPSLLSDGRIIYSRWEYTDKPLWRIQKLWTTNQDGTGTAHFWGNQSVWPDHTSEPRQIPGSRRIIFSGVGHHDWWSGSIGIIDPEKGRDFPHGLTKVTADKSWPEVAPPPHDPIEAADYHPAGHYTGYKTPYPLSEEDFLVSARRDDGKFRLYLMDVHGNRDLIYEGQHNIWHAIPVKPRLKPPTQPNRVAWPGTGKDRKPAEPGLFFSADVCEGAPGLPRASVKYLRVFQLDYKTYSTWNKSYRNSGPAVSIIQEEGVKRILTEVPVESDGSVYFKVPAGRSLFFQLLDADRRCLQTMRSFAGLMPGEIRGCVGCHESHSTTPPARGGLASRRPPTELTPPPWGTDSISFERFAQPLLDRYCVKCHQGQPPGPDEPNLRLRPGVNVFKEPYLTLVGAAGWNNPVRPGRPGFGIAAAIPVESAYNLNDPRALATLPPMKYLSPASRLLELASSGKHHNVKADPEDLRRLIAWIDANCPFLGENELRALGDPDFPGIDRLPIRPRVTTAPLIERP